MFKNTAIIFLVSLLFVGSTTSTALAQDNWHGPPGRCPVDAPMSNYVDRAFYGSVGKTHATHIDCVSYLDIAVGYNSQYFGSPDHVTRAQMATFLVRTFEVAGYGHLLPASDRDLFIDTARTPHRHNINRIANAGLVQGIDNNRYAPYDVITKAQAATIVTGMHRLITGHYFVSEADFFPDVPHTNIHHQNINLARELNLVTGRVDGNYEPRRRVYRAQMTTFAVNLLAEIW